MRFFELALISILSLRTLAFLVPTSHIRLGFSTLTLIILLCHTFSEGWRWQMIPLYALALFLLFIDITYLKKHKRQIWAFLLCLALLVLFTALPAILPVPKLPQPTGQYAVGTTSFEILDESRNRKLPVRIWYPTESINGLEQAPWLNHLEEMKPSLAWMGGLPTWSMQHLSRMQTHSYVDAEIIEEAKPVILFSHGQYGFKAQSSFLAESLASHGYVFIAPDHVGGALFTVYEDGSTVDYIPSEFAEGLEGDEFDVVIRELGQKWAADLSFILDSLATEMPELDTSKVVASGHSTGGGSSLEFCRLDNRCAGVIALDPWLLPASDQSFEEGIAAPILTLFSDPRLDFFEPPNHAAFARLAEATQASGHEVREKVIEGSKHHEFSDGALLSPIGYRLGLQKGPIKTHRSMQITTEQSLVLLNHVFNGDKAVWGEYPEEIDWVEGY